MSESEKHPVARTSMGAGQFLVILGLIIVYGVGGYWFTIEVIGDPESPWWLKIGMPAIVIGITIMFLTALVQRIRVGKTDKYTDVEE